MKIKKISILCSFIGLWLTSYLSDIKQIFVGFVLILSFGILHGANDLVIYRKLNTNNVSNFHKNVIQYVSIIILAIIMFYFVPFITLILFVLISGLHFGEQHWNQLYEEKNKLLKNVHFTSYGLLILFLLFYFNPISVKEVVQSISGVTINHKTIFYTLLFIVFTFLSLSVYLYQKNQKFSKVIFEELFYLLLFVILFKVSSLIWGFTIYFIIWHSIPSLSDQIQFLYGESNRTNFIRYFKDALLYWIMALLGLAAFYYYFNDSRYFISIFFSFLAAITFPHVLVIFNMFKIKKTELNE